MPDNFDADAMMAFIGQLGKEVDNLKTKITSLNEAGGKGMGNLADQTDRFGKVIQQYTSGPIKAMDAAAAGLSRTLVGAGGLALSFAGVAKALDTFAVGELRIKNFATNTGFTVETVKNLRVQLAAAGIDAGEASSGIGSIGAKLQEVLALQETSSFYRSLQASSPALAEQVRQLMNAGKQQEALNVLQEAYNNGGERFKAWLPTATGYSRAAFEAGIVGMKGLIEPWKFNDDKAKEYHKTMTNLDTISTSLWTDMSYTMLEGISKMMGVDGIDGLNKKAHEFAAGFKSFFNTYVMPTLDTTVQEFNRVVDAFVAVDKFFTKWAGIKKEGEQKDDKDKPLGLRTERAIIGSMNEQLPGGKEGGTAPSKIWEWLKNQFSMEAGAAEAGEGHGPLLVQEEETKKETNKSVRDMRDIMQKWDQKEGAGGGMTFRPGVMGGGLGPFGGTGGTTFRPGITGGGRSRGGDGTGGDGTGTAPADDKSLEGTQGSDYLAARRAPIKAEIEGNPALKKEVAAMMTMEHESDPVAVMESLANRTDYINTERAKQGKPPLSVSQMLHGGFYGPAAQFANRARQLEGQPNRLKRMYDAMDAVWAGSNLLFGATDQGSGSDPNVGWQGGKIVRFGETYNDWGGGPGGHEGARRYREMIQKGFREGVKRGVWAGNAGAVPFLDGSQWGQPAFADRFGDWTKRNKIDEALRTASGRSGNLGTAKVDIEFTGNKSKDDVWTKGTSPFIPTKISRSPQAPIAGGGVAAFNTYSFE